MTKCYECGKTRNLVEAEIDGVKRTICNACLDRLILRGYAVDEEAWDDEEDEFEYPEIKTPSEIKNILDKHVIGQERAKKIISVGIYNHYKRIYNNRTDIKKSNILMVGPTGVGKTEIARTVAMILDVPFCICDATSVTEAGYVGDDVENMLLRLIQAAEWDMDLAERGIIYIDEFDKIARKSENTSITRDVSGEGVQQALLKIIEGAEIDVPTEGGRKHPHGDRVRIDTSNILFICGGAFEGLTMKKDRDKNLGFVSSKEEKKSIKKIEPNDIKKQGIIPELVGRLPVIAVLEELTKDDLKKILTDTENSIVKQYTSLVGLDNIALTFSDEAIEYIANKAIENDTGARGLKGVIEDEMIDLMFEIPDEKDVKAVEVIVKDGALSFKKKKKKIA